MSNRLKITLYVLGALVIAGVALYSLIVIPAFEKYAAKSKTSEARQFVRRLLNSVESYYSEYGTLWEAIGPTPSIGSCCSGKDVGCEPDSNLWEARLAGFGFCNAVPALLLLRAPG